MPLSKRDNDLMSLSSKGETPDAIALKMGTSPERVVQEIDRLTKSLDWLSEPQKYVLLRHKLWTFVNNMEQAVKDQGYDPKVAEAYLKGLESALNQVEKAESRVTDNLDRVQAAYAREMMNIIEKSFYVTLDRLERRGLAADREEIEAEFQEAIVWVAAEIDQHERDDE